jgi:predicted phosphodiesterase
MKIRVLSDLHLEFLDLMEPRASVWIHGHTHESFDYVVNGTRVVCNPRGYLRTEPNEAFDPLLAIDVSVTSRSLMRGSRG